jgi:sugar lactone lactonase YvrE
MLRKIAPAWVCLFLCAARLRGQVITTIAGTEWHFPAETLPAVNAPLGSVASVTVDGKGNVYASDPGNNLVIRISFNGTLTVVAGNGISGFSGDGGPATNASLNAPAGIALDTSGNLYIADTGNGRVRKVSNGIIATIAGGSTQNVLGDGGPAINATLLKPTGLALDSSGNLFITDPSRSGVRKVSPSGIITTVKGEDFGGSGIAVDSGGNLYVAAGSYVLKDANGIVTTFAGGTPGVCQSPGSGVVATSACLHEATGVAVDAGGDVYIADTLDNLILKITNGILTTVAGSGAFGFFGDGGKAVVAGLNEPVSVAVDPAGTVYIADSGNYRIRTVATDGIIETLGGNGQYGFSGDGGLAASASLFVPHGLAVDSTGNLYIADVGAGRIRKVSPSGIITTVAGNGTEGSSGDGGPATSASLAYPVSTAVDPAGNVYIADSAVPRMRVVEVTASPTQFPTGTFVRFQEARLQRSLREQQYTSGVYPRAMVNPSTH